MLALVGLVLIPHEATRVVRSLAASVQQRRTRRRSDGVLLEQAYARGGLNAHRGAEGMSSPQAAQPAVTDTLSPELKAERDTLTAAALTLQRDGNAPESPLPPAFKALARRLRSPLKRE